MDFVFFAFSSLCVGLIVLLIALITGLADHLIDWRFLIAAVILGILYYTLLSSIARNHLTLYYLFNMVPQITLLLTLSIYMKKNRGK